MGIKAFSIGKIGKEKVDPFSLLIFFGLLFFPLALSGLCLNFKAPTSCFFSSYLIVFFGMLLSVSLVLFIRSLESRKNWFQTLALEKARKVRRKIREMIVLDRAIQWIAAMPKLDLLAQKVPELFIKISGAENASFLLLDQQKKITSFDHSPVTNGPARDIHFKIAEQYVQESKTKYRGILINISGRQALFKELDIDKSSGAWIILPLQTHDQLLGLVLVNRSACQPSFTKADFRRLTIVATQLSETLRSTFYLKQAKTKADLYKRTCLMLIAAQNEIMEVKRLTAIGRLLLNATHDLKNPLSVFTGYTELILKKNTDPEIQGYLRKSLQVAQRCHRVVQDLLLFAQRKQPERSRVDICQLMEETLSSLYPEIQKKNITVEKDWNTTLPHPLADPHQLIQVFTNIILNACQAIETVPGERKIHIGIRGAGSGIEIRIADNGPGILKENLEKIFEPFFTTRGKDSGTGLGLSICTEIIKSYGGKITAQNNPETGSSFVIMLPLGEMQTESALLSNRVTKAVLVIDDEEDICEMTKEILEEEGFLVDTEADGESALQRLENHYYDLILCDYIIPKMNGCAVYEYLKITHPRQASRFVFMTGSVMGEELMTYFKDNQVPYLLKPLNTDNLIATTRELINKPNDR